VEFGKEFSGTPGFAVAAGSKVNRDGSKVENCILREITIDPLFGGGSEEAGA
jgi:hypothetical protein